MATTNNFSLPYPQGNDPYNIPEDIENLAKSIDSSLKAVSDSVATLDYSTTETVEEVKKNLEILEQEINRAGLPNIERIMIDIEEARKELEAAKEEFSVGQAELGVHLTNLRDERMPALEKSVRDAQVEMDTAMDEFMTRQTQFEDSISTAEEDIAEAKRRLDQNEEELDRAGGIKDRLETAETNIQNKVDSSRVDEVEDQVDTALTGPVTHDRLRAGSGAFDSAFVGELWAKNIRALSAELARVVVSAQNYAPAPGTEPDQWQVDSPWTLTPSIHAADGMAFRATPDREGRVTGPRFKVTPGETLKFEITYGRIGSSRSNGGRFLVGMLGYETETGGVTSFGPYVSGSEINGTDSANWDTKAVGTVEVPEGVEWAAPTLYMYAATDTPTDNAHTTIYNFRTTKLIDGSMVVENSIDTRHLNVTSEMTAALIKADTAEVIDLIAEDLIADNATLINAAMQNLTVTERANFVDAFAKELYAERFTSEVANIANLTVAARNLIPGMFNIANEYPPPFEPSGFGVNTGDPSVWIQGTKTLSTSGEEDALIYLEAGVNYKFSVETAASVPGTMYYVQLIDENGNNATDTVVELTETSYILSQEIAGPDKNNWWPAEATFWVQKTGGYRLKIYANHNRGADNLDGYQWFRNMRVENMNDGRLIVPGTIDASRLNVYEIFSNQLVSDQIWANTVRTNLLAADEALIGGALIKDEEITVNKLTALDEMLGEMLRVRKIDAGDIAADAITAGKIAGGAIDGKTITGATVRTSSSGKRVEMRNDAVTAYDSSNSIQARYSGDGIELRPPGGSLTEIGPHIFGSEVITRATNQPWVSATTIPEGGESSWSTYLTNATNSVAFPMVSHRYVFDFTFMYMPGGGNMHESYASVLSNIQIATSSSNVHTVMDRIFFTRGWWSNTDYQLTYTTSATLPSSKFSIGDMIYPRFRFRSRSVNFGATVHSFIFKATPA